MAHTMRTESAVKLNAKEEKKRAKSSANGKRKAAEAPAARQVKRKVVAEELKPVHHPSHGTVSVINQNEFKADFCWWF